MNAFYQMIRWLDLKSRILDEPVYSKAIHDELSKFTFDKVLDCGTGAGHFVRKITEFVKFGHLIGFDVDTNLIDAAQQTFSMSNNIEFLVQDFYNLDPNNIPYDFDLITGQAFLEHTNLGEAIRILNERCKPGGYVYFAHNYTSPAIFEPSFDSVLDRAIVENFDAFSIENQEFGGKVCGESRCGTKLYHLFKDSDFEILYFTSTDWFLYPKGGGYTEEEKELLSMVVEFFYTANTRAVIPSSRRINTSILESWRNYRNEQINSHQLIFMCPQTSILARKL